MASHSSILAWKNPTDRGAWWTTVHRIANSQTRLNNWARMHAHLGNPVLDTKVRVLST